MTAPGGVAPSYTDDPDLNASIESSLDAVGGGDPVDEGTAPADGGSVETPTGDSQTPSLRDDGTAPPAVPSPDGQTPADGTTPEADEAQFEPFIYTVNGESRTLDGFHVVPNEGVYVPTEQVPRLQQLASRADASEAMLREMHGRTQDYDRYSQWNLVGPDGKVTETLSGPQGIEAMRVAYANAAAGFEALANRIKDPMALVSLLQTDGQGQFAVDQNGRLVINPREWSAMMNEIKLGQMTAEQRVRQHFQGMQRPGGSPAPMAAQAPTESSPALQLALEQAQTQVQQLAQSWGVSGLTAADVATAARVFPRYVRTATVQDVAQDPLLKVGQPVIENEFRDLLQSYAQIRQQTAGAGKVNQFNAGQRAGTANGRPTPARPAAPPPPATPPTTGRKQKVKPQWDAILERGMADPDVQAALRGET